MIKTKNDLVYYLECDKVALFVPDKNKRPTHFNYIWKYQIALRKAEYHLNNKGICHKFLYYYHYYRFRKMGIKLNIEIWPNQFGPGLSIAHAGTIIVNGNASIGANCRIHEGVTIGATNGSELAAIIGDNVFIGSGAKIIGEVTIANGVAIGANSVVVKSVKDENVSIAGVPAKIISRNGSDNNLRKATSLINPF